MQVNPSFLEERVLPLGGYIRISPIWAPIWRSGEDPGDEIGKTGVNCFTKTLHCLPIGGFVGFSGSKKGLNRPKWRGNLFPGGLADVETGKCGFGDPTWNAPDLMASGDEREESMKDRRGDAD